MSVGRGAVVENAAVRGPRKGPPRIEAEPRRVFLGAARHRLLHRIELGFLVVVVAREDPDAAGGRAVGLEVAVALEELAGLDVEAVQSPAECADVVLAVDLVAHLSLEDRIGAGAAFLFIEGADALEKELHDLEVRLALSRRFNRLLAPLNPAARIVDRARLFIDERGRQEVDLGLDFLRIHIGRFPEGGRFSEEPVGHDEPVELRHRLAGVLGVGRRVSGIHAPAEVALRLVVAHVVEGRDRRVVAVGLLRTDLREQVVAVVVVDGRVVAEPFLQAGDPKLGLIAVVTRRVRFLLEIVAKGRVLLARGPGKVTRRLMAGGSDVGRALHVRFAAKGVDAAARDADVAEKKLHNAHGAAVLTAVGVLRLAERVEDRTRLVGAARRGVDVPDLEHDVLVHAGHFRHDVGRVAGVMARHDVQDAHRIRECFVAL